MHFIPFGGTSDGALMQRPNKMGNAWLGEKLITMPTVAWPKHAAQLIDALARNNAERIRLHPFVKRSAEGSATLEELEIFLVQHGKYSRRFTRYLCVLLANLDDSDDVMQLASNVLEELGFDNGGAPEPYVTAYGRMLDDLGIDAQETAMLPGTSILIDTMFRYCRYTNPVYGLAALYLGSASIVPPLYRDLIPAFVACGIPERRLDFFRIRVDAHASHGKTMHAVLARLLDRDPTQLEAVLEASTKLIEARWHFFNSIELAAA